MNNLLIYHKLIDDYKDKKSYVSYLGSKLLQKDYNAVRLKYFRQEKAIAKGVEKISVIERKSYGIEEPNSNAKGQYLEFSLLMELSDAFGEILEEVFVFEKDENSDILGRVGYNMGKYIYILDAIDDLPKDIKNKSFNPLSGMNLNEIKDTLRMELEALISGIEEGLKELRLNHSAGIINNIVVHGLRNKADKVLNRRKYCR